MTFAVDLDVAATPAEVFRFIADFANAPKWYSAVKRVERPNGVGGVGTRYAGHRQLPSGAVTNDVIVDSYIDGQEITFTSVNGPTPFTYKHRIQSAPHGARLQLEGTISLSGLPRLGTSLAAVARTIECAVSK